MHFPGASNIADGVTIDLVDLNQVTVSNNGTRVAVGPGNRWRDVFAKLDPLGISVLGGRWATVGVGGLLTGGGISFFSRRFGLAMDGVVNHEVRYHKSSIQHRMLTCLSGRSREWDHCECQCDFEPRSPQSA
jgi:FAD/FMN-containing dehydrogenase